MGKGGHGSGSNGSGGQSGGKGGSRAVAMGLVANRSQFSENRNAPTNSFVGASFYVTM